MKRAILVVFLSILAGLFTLPSARASEDGYTAVGGGYFTDANKDFYTRERAYWGYYTDAYNRYIPRFYYWKYTPANKPVTSLTADSTDAEWIDYLKNHDTIAGGILARQQKDEAFLAKLKAIGVPAPFPALPGYNGGGYGSSYSKLGVLQGNTIYGAYSYSQVADLYNQTDMNVLFQQSAALVKGAQGLASDGNTQFSALVQQANAGAARVAEIRAEGEVAVEKLRAVRPPSRVVTTINGQTVSPADPTPGPMGKVVEDAGQGFAAHKIAVIKTDCIQCHSGAKPDGKLDLSKSITADQYLAVLNRVSLPVYDKRHMPQQKDGGPGRQLKYNEIRDLIP